MMLSVVIPVYNAAPWLPRCLDSLLAQDMLPDEILLVDDGSTDGRSGAICDEYAARRPDLFRVVHVPNGGVGAARNLCVELARGDYLLFVDSDDAVSPRLVSTLYPYMRQGIDGVIFSYLVDCDGRRLPPPPDSLPRGTVTSLQDYPELLFASPCPWNKLWRRSLYTDNAIRFPEGILFEDLSAIPRLYALASRVAVIEDVLYYYSERNGSIMRSRNAERDRDVMKAMDRLADWYREAGLYSRYRTELEALAVQHVLLAASVRALGADPSSPVMGELGAYIEENYPAWRSNPYVKKYPLKHKLILRLLHWRQYRLIRSLFLLKDGQ